ncbi:MAG TPA: DnaJ domain-containing protein [Methylovirgula sp.]|jgi:hypothetical protein|nr:DnaJ domain-containing protein [Methylovirgula sp.]
MPYILAGFLILWLALFALRSFLRVNPAKLVRSLKTGLGKGLNRGFGFVALAVALLLVFRGQIDFGVIWAGVGIWILASAKRKNVKGQAPQQLEAAATAAPSAPRARLSRVRSAVIEMELDHQTGTISGTVLAGPDEGASLERLSRAQCEALHRLCLRDDPEGARLLEAYLDRRFPGWRGAVEEEPDAWGARPAVAPRLGAMTEDEAYEILGLRKGATRDEVLRSHRSLIKRLHPDQGGSTDLAARVNEAKDVLMRRHN